MPRFQAALAGLLFAFSAQAETLYTVQLTPTPNPTVISSGGGVAKYDRVVSNQSGANLALSYRGLLTRADGAELPITGELALNLPPDGKSALTGLGFSVPYNYPAGNYSYSLYYREPGKPGYSKHSFGFSKSGTNPAPTPRVSVQLAPLAGTRLPLSGGTLTFSATLKNISTTTSETVQYWAILALPSGDRRVIAPVSSRSLTAGSSFKPMDLAVALSATDPNGDYLLTLYAISTNRSTPAVKQQVALSKEGERIDAMALADLNFDRCLKESAMQNGWQYIEEVVALDCRNRGIKVADGIELLTALTALDLSGNELRFFSNGVSSSSSPWTIQRLNLAGNRLEQFDLPQPWPALRELDLSGNRLRYLPLGFAASENLESLSLADNDLDNARELQGLLDDLPLLKKLDLSGIYLADTDILYWLGSLMLLEELDLSHTGLADPMLPVLPELKRLRLAGVPMLSTNRLQHLDQLTVLDLSGNGLIDLYGLQQLHLLEELRLSDNTGIPGYQVQMLLSGNPQLKQVALANLALEFDVVELLQNSGAASHIEELDLANSNQRPYSLPFPQLKRLNLSNNPLEFLPPLLAPDKLQELQLANTLLHDLSGFELFQALTVLDLSGLSSASPWQLETLLRQNPQLQQLSLRDWHIPTPLAGLLNQMPMEQSQLLKLDLSGAAVDIQGLALPRLKQLRLAGAVLRYPAPIDDYRFPLLRELDVADINMVPHVYGLPRDLDALNLSGHCRTTLMPSHRCATSSLSTSAASVHWKAYRAWP